MRLILTKIHLWLGLSAGAVLTVMALSGAMLAFEPQMRRALGESLAAEADIPYLSPPELAQAAAEQGAEGVARAFFWDPDLALPVAVWTQREDGTQGQYLLDPQTGERLPRAERVYRVFRGILLFHRTLLAGELGQRIVGFAALSLVFIAVSGLFIGVRRWRQAGQVWWPSRRERGQPRLRLRLWHRWLGAWVTPWFLLMAITGMVWAFDGFHSWLQAFGGPSRLAQPTPIATANENSRAVAWNSIWPTALEAQGGHPRAMRFVLPRKVGDPLRFEWSPKDLPSGAMRSRLFFDPGSGEVLTRHDFADFTAGEQLVRWAYPLHTGRFAGLAGQVVAFLGALTIPFFFVSGLLLYLRRRRASAGRISRSLS